MINLREREKKGRERKEGKVVRRRRREEGERGRMSACESGFVYVCV